MGAGGDEDPRDDGKRLWLWRFANAREAGLSYQDAERFADSRADIGQLRDLAAAGCPPERIAEILL